MDYSFNSEIAKIYGVEEAVFIHNIYWWICKNEVNNKHFYDGKYWTYNSMDAFTKLFPFWTKRQVERIIRKLRERGAIQVGNYNASKLDRTQWYSLHEAVTNICANGNTDITKRVQGNTRMVTTIPDSKPDSKPDISIDCPNGNMFDEFWKAYPKKVGKVTAKKYFDKLKPDKELLEKMLNAISNQKNSKQWKSDHGQYIPNPSTWINQKRWEDEIEVKNGNNAKQWEGNVL